MKKRLLLSLAIGLMIVSTPMVVLAQEKDEQAQEEATHAATLAADGNA